MNKDHFFGVGQFACNGGLPTTHVSAWLLGYLLTVTLKKNKNHKMKITALNSTALIATIKNVGLSTGVLEKTLAPTEFGAAIRQCCELIPTFSFFCFCV